MIGATGTVVSLDGDYAFVRMDEAGCGRCHEEGGCGGNNIGRMFCSSPRLFRVRNPEKSAVGDHVSIVVEAGVVRRSAALAYGLPLLLLFLGAFSGLFFAGEAGAIVGAVLALSCSWFFLRCFGRLRPPGQGLEAYIKP